MALSNMVAVPRLDCTQRLDWFIMTWLASHIRYVSLIEVTEKIDPMDVIIWAQNNDPTLYDFTVDEWLPNCELRAVDESTIKNQLQHAESDFYEERSAGGKYNNVRGAVIPWTDSVTDSIDWAYQLEPMTRFRCEYAHKRRRSRSQAENSVQFNKYRYGPTSIAVWGTADAMYYLEIHNQS